MDRWILLFEAEWLQCISEQEAEFGSINSINSTSFLSFLRPSVKRPDARWLNAHQNVN